MSKVPAVRFKGFTDPWEQRELGELYPTITNAYVGTATPYYVDSGHFYLESNNVKDGKLNYENQVFINDEFYLRQESKWLHAGDVVVVQSGHVGHAAVIPPQLDGTAAHALIMLKNASDRIVPEYLVSYLCSPMAHKGIVNITKGNTIKHILASDMKEFRVFLPDGTEQRAIAMFLSLLDNLITLHQRKHEQLTVLKKALLDKMFPKDGARVPEIRFSGFTDPWEQRKFSELYQPNNERNVNKEFGYDRTLSIATMTFNGGNGAADSSLDTYKVIRVGDIAFEGHTNKIHAYGRFVLNDAGDGLMSPRFNCLRPICEQYYPFWKYFIPNEQMMRPILVNATKSGTMMNELVVSDLMGQSIPVPSLDEQRAVGDCLASLDNLITLHQRKLEVLRNLKSALLEKMFV